MCKNQPSQVGEPCAEQDAYQYGGGPAVSNGYEPVKAPAKKIAQGNR
jgi:hypothetical protein